MKTFCFTVDDNIRFLRELSASGGRSLFDHPYMAMYRRLHCEFGLKVQLNLFYKDSLFDLSAMSDKYADEWRENADWLKLSFHSEGEHPTHPYRESECGTVERDVQDVHREILRFAGRESLAKTTTIHYCSTRREAVGTLYANGVRGLLGLFGTDEVPRISYGIEDEVMNERLRRGEIAVCDGVAIASLDVVVNTKKREEIPSVLAALRDRDSLRVMIHEQYFYPDYGNYQPDFEDKLRDTFRLLTEDGRESRFFEELI